MKYIVLMATIVLSGCALETMFEEASGVPELLQPKEITNDVMGPLTEEDSIPMLEDRGIILEEVTDEII